VNRSGRPLVAVDIGNSAAKWSVRRDASSPASELSRVSVTSSDWTGQLIGDVLRLVAGDTAGQTDWRIAAVNSPARDQLTAALCDRLPAARVDVITRHHVPMRPRVRNPDRLGIDRLLAAWIASRMFVGRRVVVVDAGSAITIDCADRHDGFLGGAIMPGLSLQFDALGRGTDALPTILPNESLDAEASRWIMPATDTESAIRAGIMLGTAGAIDRLIDHGIASWGESGVAGDSADATGAGSPSYQVVLTGGDAMRLSPLLRSCHTVVDRLVIDALLSDEIGRERFG
jgi:type III pantothenate kinase